MRSLAIASLLVGCAHTTAPSDGRIELARARTAAARGRSLEAIALYERVPRFSLAWPRALFEEGRETARANRHSRALGLFLTLHAPQLSDWIFPEAYALEADIYLRNCHFARALATAREFRAHVLPLRDRVMDLIGGAPLGNEVPWIATRLAGATTADERWDRIDQLLVELDLADAVIEQVEAAVAEQRAILVDQGRHSFELTTYVDDNSQRYHFDGEFWPDELGNYRVAITSRCERRH